MGIVDFEDDDFLRGTATGCTYHTTARVPANSDCCSKLACWRRHHHIVLTTQPEAPSMEPLIMTVKSAFLTRQFCAAVATA